MRERARRVVCIAIAIAGMMRDAAGQTRDAGAMTRNAGTTRRDAGAMTRNAGTTRRDAGAMTRNAGTTTRDAPALRAGVVGGEMVLDLGPIDVPAVIHGDMGGMAQMKEAMPEAPPLWVLVPASGWLSGYRVELIDKNGHAVPQSVLHHVNVIATQRRELFSGIMLRVAAAGPETGEITLPGFMGYKARAGDTLLVRAMLHAGDHAYSGVHIRVRFPFRAAGGWMRDLTISPFYMDVTPPAGGHAFDIPVGHSEWFWEARPAISGRIVGFSGHVHKYATLFRFEDRTAGRVIWETRPDTDASGEPRQIPVKRFLATLGFGIRADHVYRLTVVYDNPGKTPVVDGGMGALGGVFMPAFGVEWPPVNAADKDYKLDVWAMWRP